MQVLLNPDISDLSVTGNRFCISKFSWVISTGALNNYFLIRTKLIQRTTLAESIAGDSVVGHTTAFAYLWESLSGISQDQ